MHCGIDDFILQFGNEAYFWCHAPNINHCSISLSSNPQKITSILPSIDKIFYTYNHVFILSNNPYDWENRSDSRLLYGMGINNCGQLGIGNTKRVCNPIEIKSINEIQRSKLTQPKKICTGSKHTLLLFDSGEVYAWGENDWGQLGQYVGGNECLLPLKIELPPIKKISCGVVHSLALTFDGEIYVWGANNICQLGLGFRSTKEHLPSKLNLPKIKTINCCRYHSVAISESNEIYVWGYNSSFQLGLGHCQSVCAPTKLNLPNIKKISCGRDYTIALTNSGEMYGWGWQPRELITSIPCYHQTPSKLQLENVKDIVCRNNLVVIVTYINEIYLWGEGYGDEPVKFKF
jgi:alpha-tubulin suppressor-like RCC1 family protein